MKKVTKEFYCNFCEASSESNVDVGVQAKNLAPNKITPDVTICKDCLATARTIAKAGGQKPELPDFTRDGSGWIME